MLDIIDIEAELSKLTMLKGRTKDTTPKEFEKAFTRLSPYRDGGIFTGSFSGEGRWERHPKGDELVHVLKGDTEIIIMTEAGPTHFNLKAGMMFVVPQGLWHRFNSPSGVTVMTVTPHPTEHTSEEFPRSTKST